MSEVNDLSPEEQQARVNEAYFTNAYSQPLDRSVSEALSELLDIPHARMAETTFRTKYLKMLSPIPPNDAEVETALNLLEQRTRRRPTRENLKANLISEWVDDISGTGKLVNATHNWTDIIGSEGEVLFSVPPLMRSRDIPNDIAAKIVDVVLLANAQFAAQPIIGDSIMRRECLPLIPKPALDVEYVEAWNKIFKYYNLPLYDVENGTYTVVDNSAKVTNPDAVDDIYDYD